MIRALGLWCSAECLRASTRVARLSEAGATWTEWATDVGELRGTFAAHGKAALASECVPEGLPTLLEVRMAARGSAREANLQAASSDGELGWELEYNQMENGGVQVESRMDGEASSQVHVKPLALRADRASSSWLRRREDPRKASLSSHLHHHFPTPTHASFHPAQLPRPLRPVTTRERLLPSRSNTVAAQAPASEPPTNHPRTARATFAHNRPLAKLGTR